MTMPCGTLKVLEIEGQKMLRASKSITVGV